MKYGFMQRAMWFAFRGTFKKSLYVFGEAGGNKFMSAAKKTYKAIIAEIDEFKKDDRFLVNILSCAMLSSVLLNLKSRPSLEEVRLYYKKSMDDNFFMRYAATHSTAYTEKGRNKLKASAKKSKGNLNPYSWKYSVTDGQTINEYTATFYTCGICYLMERLGLKEYIPAMCSYDYDMAAMNNTSFYREYTLAGGGPYCDCHYNHKKIKE